MSSGGPSPTQISYCPLPTGHLIAYRLLSPANSSRVPLVLIHGLGAVGLVDWYPLAGSLSADRPVVVFDNRDIGWSKPPPKEMTETLTLKEMANDVVELIKHLEFESVDLLGFSMGGCILQQILLSATQLPFSIKHAILASTFSITPKDDGRIAALFFPSQEDKPGETAEHRKYRFVKKLLEGQYDAAWLADSKNSELFELRIGHSLTTQRPIPAIMRQAFAFRDVNLTPDLPSIPKSIPVLSIHGTKDQVVAFEEQATVLRFISHAQAVRTPDASYGHMWYDYFGLDFWKSVFKDFLDEQYTGESKL